MEVKNKLEEGAHMLHKGGVNSKANKLIKRNPQELGIDFLDRPDYNQKDAGKPWGLWQSGLVKKLFNEIPQGHFVEVMSMCLREFAKQVKNVNELHLQLVHFCQLDKIDKRRNPEIKTYFFNVLKYIQFDDSLTLEMFLKQGLGSIETITDDEWRKIASELFFADSKNNGWSNLTQLFLVTEDPGVLEKIATVCIETLTHSAFSTNFALTFFTKAKTESKLWEKYKLKFLKATVMGQPLFFSIHKNMGVINFTEVGLRDSEMNNLSNFVAFLELELPGGRTSEIVWCMNELRLKLSLLRAQQRLSWVKVLKEKGLLLHGQDLGNDMKEMMGKLIDLHAQNLDTDVREMILKLSESNFKKMKDLDEFIYDQVCETNVPNNQAILNKIQREYGVCLFAEAHTPLRRLTEDLEEKVKEAETNERDACEARKRENDVHEFLRICALSWFYGLDPLSREREFIEKLYRFIGEGKLTPSICQDLAKEKSLSCFSADIFQEFIRPEYKTAFQRFLGSDYKQRMKNFKAKLKSLKIETEVIDEFCKKCKKIRKTIVDSPVWRVNSKDEELYPLPRVQAMENL
ncbi:MAG: hypothetical protein VW378_04820 [bacterium]